MEVFSYTVPLWAVISGVAFLLGVFLKLALKILLVIILGSIVLFVLHAAGFFPWLQSLISGIV